MAVRAFTNGGGHNASIHLSPGDVDTVLAGACTVVAVIRRNGVSNTQSVLSIEQSGTHRGGMWVTAGNDLQAVSDGISTAFGFSLPSAADLYVAWDKAAGGTVTPRGHWQNLTTPSTMAHADAGGTVNADANVATQLCIGNAPGDWPFEGDILALAAFDVRLTDAEHEAQAHAFRDWLDNGAVGAWALDQASVATPVSDATAGGADQTAETGTSVDARIPTNFSQLVSGPPSSAVVAIGPGDNSSPASLSYDSHPGKGYVLVVGCTSSAGVNTTVTDTAGNTWDRAAQGTGGVGRAIEVWTTTQDVGQFTSVSVAWTAGPTDFRVMQLIEVTGGDLTDNAAFVDAAAANVQAASATPPGVSATPTVADTLAITATMWNPNNHNTVVNTPTGGGTWTKPLCHDDGPASAWLPSPTSGVSLTASWSRTGGSGGNGQAIILIAPAAGGPSTQTLIGASIASTEAFGAGTVNAGQVLVGAPIASAEAFGAGALVIPTVTAGPVLGAITDDAVTVVYKLAGVTVGTDVRVSADDGGGRVFSSIVNPDANGWVRATVSGLDPDTDHLVELEVDGAVLSVGTGNALTDPTPGTQASFSIAFGSCNVTVPTGPTYAEIAGRLGAFGDRARRLVHMGDKWYEAWDTDAEVEDAYSDLFANATVGPHIADLAWASCWDNNDWGGSDSDASWVGADELADGYRAYEPHYTLPATDGKGIWQSWVIGRIRFIMLDTRSQRDPQADPDGPSKTMLGTEQKTWFAAELQQPEEVKIICSSIPWRAFGGTSGGRWQSYLTEWDEVNDLIDLHASGRVYAIFGDRHALAADDGSASNARGVPQSGGAPFQQGSVALPGGEVWSNGYWAGPGGGPEAITVYGWLDIDDQGDQIVIDYEGVDAATDTVRLTMTTTFDLGQTLTAAAGIASAEAFGAGAVIPDQVLVAAAGIASAEAFGPGVMVPDQLVSAAAGIASAEAFGAGLVQIEGGPQTLVGVSIASAEAFGPGSVAPGPVFVTTAAGIASQEAFGAGALTVGPVTLVGAGIPSAEAFETGLVFIPGAATIITSPGGIQSAEAFGPGLVAMMGEAMQTAPCSWNIDTTCAADWLTYSEAVRERATAWATEILWALSGRQFGACAVTARPCVNCNPASYEEWGVWLDGYGGFGGETAYFPYVWDGRWRNCGCAGICGCGVSQEVWLPGPVSGIVEVSVAGVVVPANTYRVDNGQYLVNEDPANRWPDQQTLDNAAGGENTFTVTYLRGSPPPRSGEIAAGALAWEFAKACTNAPCRLPGSVASIVRQGVEMTLVQDEAADWLTGIHEADQFLKAFNPGRLRARPRVSSIDLQAPRVTTWGF